MVSSIILLLRSSGIGLAFAMEQGRILLFHWNRWGFDSMSCGARHSIKPRLAHSRLVVACANAPHLRNSTWVYTSKDTCGDLLTPDCYFRPLSRCQVNVKSWGRGKVVWQAICFERR